MPLKLYNTLTRRKEVFKPLSPKQVKMYTCGPTVYWYQHIGNLKAYLFADLLKRVLIYNNFKTRHIINITDVGHLTSDADDGEDKIEKAAKKENTSAQEIANYYFSIFEKDLKKLNIIQPTKWTKATEHIKEQISLIKKLEKKGYTYKTSDGIYFDSSKFKTYSKLAKLNICGLKEGKRISKGGKKNKTDFALWKFSPKNEKRQQEWESPWGIGFPGWHIECSAMSMKYLGETFDIHTGGEDHVPIHHTNEIAQSEAATGKKFVNYWIHSAFLINKDGEKISKSKGGLYTLSNLEQLKFSPEHYRYYNLLTHYRKPLQFSLENLEAAKNTYKKLKRKIQDIHKQIHKASDLTKQFESKFLNDDLNLPQAVQIIWETVNDFDFDPKKKIQLLEKFDKVLGLNIKSFTPEKTTISKPISILLKKRESFRTKKDFKQADIIRQKILELGFTIEDSSEGPKLIKN
jgi:cysteinyl-tRNA synthetase